MKWQIVSNSVTANNERKSLDQSIDCSASGGNRRSRGHPAGHLEVIKGMSEDTG
jgi:hypothetical protein